jgi:N-methylhydantoinase A/oxoprolinase/acetone carboxylase beta subunit
MRTNPALAARGVIRVVNANMERAIRVITVERGFDPRDFALLAFGGAGPMHACELALDLGIRHIVLPRNPGLLCAWGALGAPLGREYSMTIRDPSPRYRDLVNRATPMTRRAIRELSAEGISRAQIEHELFVDMRYRGQSYELEVALTPRFIEEFHSSHQMTFGHSSPDSPVEVVNLRLRSSASGPSVAPRKIARSAKSPAPVARIDTLVGDKVRRVQVYARDDLGAGARIDGPSIVVELSATSYVAPEFLLRVDDFGNLHLEMRA